MSVSKAWKNWALEVSAKIYRKVGPRRVSQCLHFYQRRKNNCHSCGAYQFMRPCKGLPVSVNGCHHHQILKVENWEATSRSLSLTTLIHSIWTVFQLFFQNISLSLPLFSIIPAITLSQSLTVSPDPPNWSPCIHLNFLQSSHTLTV